MTSTKKIYFDINNEIINPIKFKADMIKIIEIYGLDDVRTTNYKEFIQAGSDKFIFSAEELLEKDKIHKTNFENAIEQISEPYGVDPNNEYTIPKPQEIPTSYSQFLEYLQTEYSNYVEAHKTNTQSETLTFFETYKKTLDIICDEMGFPKENNLSMVPCTNINNIIEYGIDSILLHNQFTNAK